MNTIAWMIYGVGVLCIVFGISAVVIAVMATRQMKKEHEPQTQTPSEERLPYDFDQMRADHVVMTPDQKAFALLYGRVVPAVVLKENLGNDWERTIKTFHEMGFVFIHNPDNQEKTQYSLTTRGKQHYLSLIVPMENNGGKTD